MKKIFWLLSCSVFLFSCDPSQDGVVTNIDTYVPIYSTLSGVQEISLEPQQTTINAGKIYAYRNYIFQNDVNSGIHIIDNTDRKNPVKIAFLKLPLNTEMAIKGGYLYANNYLDLVVFDLTNPTKPKLVKRVPNVFPDDNQDFPPFKNVYFQCPDPSKGIIIGWEKANIPTPNCRR